MKDTTDLDTLDFFQTYDLAPTQPTGLARLSASPVGAVGQGATLFDSMHCQECGELLIWRRGRAPTYCSPACKQAAYRFRKAGFERQRTTPRMKAIQDKAFEQQRADSLYRDVLAMPYRYENPELAL